VKLENINKNNKDLLQSDAYELSFQQVTDTDLANASGKQK
jgi:hypothetical protein